MPILSRILLPALLLVVSAAPVVAQTPPPASAAVSKSISGILTKDQVAALLPPSVYFRGQSAPIQARNSAGIRFAPDALMLITLVDTSGYSSGIQQRYQAYLLTEVPLDVAGHTLPPGAYGVGFIANDTFLVMDIGAHQLFTTKDTHDAELRRPTPLQILPDAGHADSYRLYAGRSYVVFTAKPLAGTAPQSH